jgi:hypothetical protein
MPMKFLIVLSVAAPVVLAALIWTADHMGPQPPLFPSSDRLTKALIEEADGAKKPAAQPDTAPIRHAAIR